MYDVWQDITRYESAQTRHIAFPLYPRVLLGILPPCAKEITPVTRRKPEISIFTLFSTLNPSPPSLLLLLPSQSTTVLSGGGLRGKYLDRVL